MPGAAEPRPQACARSRRNSRSSGFCNRPGSGCGPRTAPKVRFAPGQPHGLELQHHRGAGRILGQGLVDAQRQLVIADSPLVRWLSISLLVRLYPIFVILSARACRTHASVRQTSTTGPAASLAVAATTSAANAADLVPPLAASCPLNSREQSSRRGSRYSKTGQLVASVHCHRPSTHRTRMPQT